MTESFISPAIDFIFKTPYLLHLIIISIGIGFVVYIYYTKKEKKEKFQEISLEEIILKDMDKRFSIEGTKVNGGISRGSYEYISNFDKYIKLKGIFIPLKWNKEKDMYMEYPKEKKPYEILAFRINKTNKIFNFFGIKKNQYILIDVNHIDGISKKGNKKIWNISPDIQLVPFAGNHISSEVCKEFLTDISIKYSYENTLTYLTNFTRKAIFLEMQHSKNINTYEKKRRIDSDYWNRHKDAQSYSEGGEKEE